MLDVGEKPRQKASANRRTTVCIDAQLPAQAIDEDFADRFVSVVRRKIRKTRRIAYVLGGVCVCASAAVVVAGIVIFIVAARREPKNTFAHDFSILAIWPHGGMEPAPISHKEGTNDNWCVSLPEVEDVGKELCFLGSKAVMNMTFFTAKSHGQQANCFLPSLAHLDLKKCNKFKRADSYCHRFQRNKKMLLYWPKDKIVYAQDSQDLIIQDNGC